MIIPSIDISGGETVQLVGGEEPALTAGDPREVLERLSLVGEVAVIDIDAARGEGNNSSLIEEMARSARIRVGGGIRSAESALDWLDRGAERVIVGTAADEDLLASLPSERVIVALDARDGEVVTHGWRRSSGQGLIDSVRRFRGHTGGFLVTVVEREGRMAGTDLDLAGRVVAEAGGAEVTIAGGVTSVDEIAALDEMGADAQVGMALYTGRLSLASSFAAPLHSDRADGLWPTVVVDEQERALGLAWSSLESLTTALETRRGVYQSRSRGLWFKGATSGAVQELTGVSLDCDRDVIRFTVRQTDGFCHLGTRTCWGTDHGAPRLARRLAAIATERPEGSNTVTLFEDDALLTAKLMEEAAELGEADDPAHIAEEAADLLYFTLVKCVAAGVGLEDIEDILDRRERRVRRRPMTAKGEA